MNDKELRDIIDSLESQLYDKMPGDIDRAYVLGELIASCFSWASTDEGLAYWNMVHRNLKRRREHV